MRNKLFSLKSFWVLIICYLLVAFILFPLYNLVAGTKSWSDVATTLVQKQTLKACLNSLLLSFFSVVGSAVIGTYFAYTFHYKKIWLKSVLSVLILLPVAIPPIVGTMSYLFLLRDNGLLMRVLGFTHFNFSGWKAILIIHLYSFYPMFYIFVGNALKTIDNSVVEASYILGSGKTQTFYKIILPQLKVPMLGAGMLTFMASMASFSAPFIFGGSIRFLTTEIYYSKINGDIHLASIYALILTLISLTVLIFFTYYSKQIAAPGKNKGAHKKGQLFVHSKYNFFECILSLLFGCIIILPIISLMGMSLLPENSLMDGGFHHHFSFTNYISLFSNSDFSQTFFNSTQASLVGVLITLVIGLLIGNMIRGKRSIFKSIVEATSSIPYGIPGTVIALFLIVSFNEPTIFSLYTILVGNFWILPIAYSIRNLPIMTQATKAGLHAIDRSIEEASTTLGASSFKTWRSITLPLIFSFVTEGALLVFINSFGEFVATILLYNYNSRTMPIEIYSQMRLFNNSTAAAYGVILFLIVMVIIFVIRSISVKQWR